MFLFLSLWLFFFMADVFKVVSTGCFKPAVNFSARLKTHDHSPPPSLPPLLYTAQDWVPVLTFN